MEIGRVLPVCEAKNVDPKAISHCNLEGHCGFQKAGYRPYMVKVYIKGIISISPNSCLSIHSKALKLLTWDVCFFVISSNISVWLHVWVSQVELMVKNSPAHAGDMKCGFNPWVGKIPWRRAWQPTPVFLPGECHGQGPWFAMIHRVAHSRTLLKWLSMHVFAFLSKNSSIYSNFSLTSLKQSLRAIWETVFWAIVLSKSAKLNAILNFQVVDFPFCQHTGPYWNTLLSSPHSPALLVLNSWQQWPPSLLGQLSQSHCGPFTVSHCHAWLILKASPPKSYIPHRHDLRPGLSPLQRCWHLGLAKSPLWQLPCVFSSTPGIVPVALPLMQSKRPQRWPTVFLGDTNIPSSQSQS